MRRPIPPAEHKPTYIKKVGTAFEFGHVEFRSPDRCHDRYIKHGSLPTYEQAFAAARMVPAQPRIESYAWA